MDIKKISKGRLSSAVICEKEKGTGRNIYRIQGSEKTVLFDAGNVPEYMISDVDILVVNNCYPAQMEYIHGVIKHNHNVILAGSADTLSFVQEYLGGEIRKHIIRLRKTMDIGGMQLQFMPVANIGRSRHQDRSWNKTYRFLHMPNWQWIDSIAVIAEDSCGKVLFSGQLFSGGEDCSLKEYFHDRIRPFREYAVKALEVYSEADLDMILPEYGDMLTADEAIREYHEYLREYSSDHDRKEKIMAIPYVSEFGYTRQLAEKVASGAESVDHVKARVLDLRSMDIRTAVEAVETADSVAVGTPTIENDTDTEVLQVMAALSVSAVSDKPAAAFGSYSYQEAGITNVMARMQQLGMKTVEYGLPIRFRPEEKDLDAAYRYGKYFAECTAAGRILPVKTAQTPQNNEPMHTDRRFIVIGNGVSGITAAEELRKLDTGCSIEIISREKTSTYNRQMLTKCMLHKIPDRNMILYGEEWYKKRDIKVSLGREAVSIDPDRKQITLDGGETRRYDKLIIASGAEPVRADVPGRELDGIFCIHDLAEADRIRGYIESNEIKEAVVIGGGIMGLETAEDLKRSGMNITIMESGPHLMMKQLDEISADLVAGRLEKQGVRVMPESTVSSFEGSSGKVEKVRLQSEKCLDAQLVIQCMGIRENSGLAESLTHSGSQGIAVNERMETGIPDIYACGDCAVYNDENFGLWPQAVEMALAAARNAADTSVLTGCRTTGAYRQILPSVTFTGFDMSFFAAGDSGKREGILYQTKETYDPQDGKYRKLFFRERQLCGFILYGDVDLTTELIDACAAGTSFDDISL